MTDSHTCKRKKKYNFGKIYRCLFDRHVFPQSLWWLHWKIGGKVSTFSSKTSHFHLLNLFFCHCNQYTIKYVKPQKYKPFAKN